MATVNVTACLEFARIQACPLETLSCQLSSSREIYSCACKGVPIRTCSLYRGDQDFTSSCPCDQKQNNGIDTDRLYPILVGIIFALTMVCVMVTSLARKFDKASKARHARIAVSVDPNSMTRWQTELQERDNHWQAQMQAREDEGNGGVVPFVSPMISENMSPEDRPATTEAGNEDLVTIELTEDVSMMTSTELVHSLVQKGVFPESVSSIFIRKNITFRDLACLDGRDLEDMGIREIETRNTSLEKLKEYLAETREESIV